MPEISNLFHLKPQVPSFITGHPLPQKGIIFWATYIHDLFCQILHHTDKRSGILEKGAATIFGKTDLV